MLPHSQDGEATRLTRYRSDLRLLLKHLILVRIMFSFLSPTCRYLGIIWGSRLDLRDCLKFEFDGQCLISKSRVSQLRMVDGKKDILVVRNL